MALSRSMFKVLVALAKSNTHMTQRQLSAASGLSLGTVNGVLHEAEDAGLIADGMLTIDGLKSLKPYEVENAIIMAGAMPLKNLRGPMPARDFTVSEYTNEAWSMYPI